MMLKQRWIIGNYYLPGGLAEALMDAQFSQLEEKEADDYRLIFLKKKEGFEPRDAVSALKKLATLGSYRTRGTCCPLIS